MNTNQVILRCEDKQEAVVFTKYEFKTHVYNSDGNIFVNKDISYEINVEDSYTGGNYKGLFGRIKRAWRAFWDKPVVYTGIYCKDKDKMRKFLENCLAIVDGTETKDDDEPFIDGLYTEDDK
jgi:hypothetical protein